MNLIFIIFIGGILASTSIVNSLANQGFLNSALTRGVTGGTVALTSSNFLVGYTNLESFISASANGSLGLAGFVFLGGFAALLITWASNLIEYGELIR